MQNRRNFLTQAGLAITAAMFSPSIIAAALANTTAAGKRQIGIQLFTLREQLLKDVQGTIAQVAKIGYQQVETFYGYPGANAAKEFWGLDAKAFKSLLKANNLTSPAGHYNTTAYLSDGGEDVLKAQIETAAIVGQKYFIIPALPTNIRQNGTLDDYKNMAAKFNRAGELCKAHGLKLAYHNHNFEFKDQGSGTTGYQILLKETDPTLVSFELDLFWAVNAGLDPVKMFKENPGRFRMWHVKDMDRTDKSVYTEVGTGSIPFKAIFAEAKLSGMEYLFIEQDVIKIDPYKSISESFNYVKHTLLNK